MQQATAYSLDIYLRDQVRGCEPGHERRYINLAIFEQTPTRRNSHKDEDTW